MPKPIRRYEQRPTPSQPMKRTNKLPDYQSNHEEEKKIQISKILMHVLVISIADRVHMN
jgi:hypothetical protein